MIKGVISELPKDDQEKITAAKEAVLKLAEEHGTHGNFGVVLAFTEIITKIT